MRARAQTAADRAALLDELIDTPTALADLTSQDFQSIGIDLDARRAAVLRFLGHGQS